MPIREFHNTGNEYAAETGFAAYFAQRDDAEYGIGVVNAGDDQHPGGFALFSREQMIALRDALNREFPHG